MAQTKTERKTWTTEDYGIVTLNLVALITVFAYDEYGILLALGLLAFSGVLAIMKHRRNKTMGRERQKEMLSKMTKATTQYQVDHPGTPRRTAIEELKKQGVFARIVEEIKQKFGPPKDLNQVSPGLRKEITTVPIAPSDKFEWAGKDTEEPAENVDVAVTNERGYEYAAMVRKILDTGDNDWQRRLGNLTAIQAEMEQIVASLREAHLELRKERELVSNLLQLKRKEPKQIP